MLYTFSTRAFILIMLKSPIFLFSYPPNLRKCSLYTLPVYTWNCVFNGTSTLDVYHVSPYTIPFAETIVGLSSLPYIPDTRICPFFYMIIFSVQPAFQLLQTFFVIIASFLLLNFAAFVPFLSSVRFFQQF